MSNTEGGIMPISQVLVTAEIQPEQRGLAMGVTQNVGSNLLGSFVTPVLLVGRRHDAAGLHGMDKYV